jgi:hypothetical protein
VVQGTVRKIHFSAPANQALSQGPNTSPREAVNARLAVLFGGGAFGVWELNGNNELKAVGPSAQFPDHPSHDNPASWNEPLLAAHFLILR